MANEEIQDEEAVAVEILGMSMPSREDEIASTEEVTGNGEKLCNYSRFSVDCREGSR